jgi:hypothetical protein
MVQGYHSQTLLKSSISDRARYSSTGPIAALVVVKLRFGLVFAPPHGPSEDQRLFHGFLPHEPPQQMPNLRHAQGNQRVFAGRFLFFGAFPTTCARTTVR